LIKNTKNKFLFFVLIFILLGTSIITSVKGLESFSGYVRDRLGNPISGVSVILTDSQAGFIGSATTNANGYYSMGVSLSGYSPYYLTAGKTGLQPYTFTVTDGGQYDFSLYTYVQGYVRNSLNEPMANVPVRVYNNGLFLATSYSQTNGYYHLLLDCFPANGQIKIEKHGYKDISLSITGGGTYDLYLRAIWAIIVGISEYQYISNLEFCDEDATDWYNKLHPMGYECRVYGDSSSNYPRYDGLATESNVRDAIQSLPAITGPGDTVCFITAGHGSVDWLDHQYLSMYNCRTYLNIGRYLDTEIADDFDDFDTGVNLFFFFDNCHSGGILDELETISNVADIYCAATCTAEGYGFDDDDYCNGLWTYYFLEFSWINHYGGSASYSMETIFNDASNNYTHSGINAPQDYDGNPETSFYL